MPDVLHNPTQAARKLGVSTKALRLYEQRGLLNPRRNDKGWRFYGDADLDRAREIVRLRELRLSLNDIGKVLSGDGHALEVVFSSHQARLEEEARDVAEQVAILERLRITTSKGKVPDGAQLALLCKKTGPTIDLELPWPWDGENFKMGHLPALTFLTGPLGSGKTRLAEAIAAHIPGAVFSSVARVTQRLDTEDEDLAARMNQAVAWLLADGASESEHLWALLATICDRSASAIVIDYIEDNLDAATQLALGAWLVSHADASRPLVVMTRSSAVLDLETMGMSTPIIYCPANHAQPFVVIALPGTTGYEAVATCLASPDVRNRTAGMTATMPAHSPQARHQ